MKKTFWMNLQLFAEGAAATGVTGTAAESQTSSAEVQSAPDAQVQEATQPKDMNAAFEELIRGEYKEQYNKRVQDTVRKRMKGAQETVDKYNSLVPLMELLGSKYGTSDIAALTKAVEEDNGLWEQEASERGISAEQLRQQKKLERDVKLMEQRLAEDSQRQAYEQLHRQTEDLKKLYPDFDLDTELQNNNFVKMLRSGIDPKTAFEVIHHDEILPAAMQWAVKQTKEQTAKAVAANAARPTENSVSSQSAATVKPDFSKMTGAEIRNIRERVMRGEKFSF